MNTALVTGASGMLGTYLVRELAEKGWGVRALVRNPHRARHLGGTGVKLVVGDLLDRESLRQAIRGCDLIVHAAAAIGSGSDWEAFRAGNVSGTGHVIQAAAAAGARLVHVSSTSVFGQDRYFEEATDEQKPLPVLPVWDAYGRSKQLAERLILEARGRGRVWAAIVRPPVMYGRWDRQFMPRIGPVLSKGFFPLFGGGRTPLSLVHAGAVAQGAILAGEADRADGQVYHLTNDFPVALSDLVRYAEEGLGRKIHSPSLPAPVARVGFGLLALGLRATGRPDLARRAQGTLQGFIRENPFTSEKARVELGWAPTVHPADGLTDAFKWWNTHRQVADEEGGGRHAHA